MDKTIKNILNRIPVKKVHYWKKDSSGAVILGLSNEHVLNKTGSCMWVNIDGKNTVSDIISMVSQNQNTKPEETIAFINYLEKENLIFFKEPLWKEEE